jgi:hypothetical protein
MRTVSRAAGRPTVADQLVRIRVSGDPAAVAEVARVVQRLLTVADESADYPIRREVGVRRYLSVLVAVPRLDSEAVR